MKLRNPWGKGEWKGKWSDTWKDWNEDLRRQLNYYPSEDGMFCMDYNDFCKYFSDVQICYYYDNYKYSSLKL